MLSRRLFQLSMCCTQRDSKSTKDVDNAQETSNVNTHDSVD